ncbi:MAG: hypothetical protein A2Y12_17215 [Planctomycetes bacterium GWF2_42_9]|nr:MAG: hypothetical protein A2Y12_17215 [Planctomycetes bacterium GWF2_42_9]
MKEEMAVQVCAKAEYQQIKNIYDGFRDLIDYQGQRESDYIYNQKKVFLNLNRYWPLIERLAKESNIELKVGPDDYKNTIFGFDRKAIARLYDSDRYPGVPTEQILGLEEKAVKANCHCLLSDILLKLEDFIEQEFEIEQNEFAEIGKQLPIKDEELTNEQAVELLGGGISASTISKWVKAGSLKGNGCKGRQHRVLKSSVLLLKHERQEQHKLKDAKDKMNIEALKEKK